MRDLLSPIDSWLFPEYRELGLRPCTPSPSTPASCDHNEEILLGLRKLS